MLTVASTGETGGEAEKKPDAPTRTNQPQASAPAHNIRKEARPDHSAGPPVGVRIAVVAAILGAGFLVWWFFFRPHPIPENLVLVSGRLEADESSIAAKVAGRIREITVREGDEVNVGQTLAMLDDAQVRAREEQAQASLEQAQAQTAAQNRQISILQEQLQQSGLAISQARLDAEGRVRQATEQVVAAEAAATQADAQRRAAQEQVNILQEQLRQRRLSIPQAELDARGRVEQAEQQVAQAEAELTRTKAQAQQAAVEADRYEKLFAEGAIDKQSAEQRRVTAVTQQAAVRAAERQVDVARGTVKVARAALTNTSLRSSEEAQVRLQISQARMQLAAAVAAVRTAKANRDAAAGNRTAARANLTNPAVRTSQEQAVRAQIAQAEAQLAAAKANARSASGRLAEAKADRADLKIVAPFAGTIATRAAEPGEVVSPGTTLLTLLDLTKVYARAYIPEGQIGKVKVGQTARVYLDSNPKQPIEAYISRIDPQAAFTPQNTYFRSDRVKQVVGVRLQLKGAVGYAKPGMPVDGAILTEGDWPAGEWRP